MMGRSHAMSGVATGIALFSPLTLPLGGRMVPLALNLGSMSAPFIAIICATMAVTALLPDWDTPSSYISTSLPPVTGWVSRRLARAGHRRFTHVLVGFVVFTAMTVVLASLTVEFKGLPVRPGNGVILMIVAATGARALGLRSPVVLWGIGTVGMLMGCGLPATALWFMPAAVLAGMWVHRLGDALTTQGTENLLWPLVRRPRLCLPVLGDAGSRREIALFWLMGLYSVAGILATLVLAP